jgi:hypothetical protein
MAFRLQTLLDLRRRAEAAAEQTLTAAMSARAKAEAAQARLDLAVREAQARLKAEQQTACDGPARAGDAIAQERFRQRLADAVRMERAKAHLHNQSTLVPATAAETEARAQLRDAQRDRKALETHQAHQEAKTQIVAERRAQDHIGDLAIAAHGKKRH